MPVKTVSGYNFYMSKDWTGNSKAAIAGIAPSNHSLKNRENDDFYATDPKAVEELLSLEKFSKEIIEPACGQGHISKVLVSHGFNVRSSDLVDRGYGVSGIDFLASDMENEDADIVTNPPYKLAQEFVEKAMSVIAPGHKVAMFLKLTFLETAKRRELFKKYPPKTVYVASQRIACWPNGKPTAQSMVCYAWFVWEKGFSGDTVLKWFN